MSVLRPDKQQVGLSDLQIHIHGLDNGGLPTIDGCRGLAPRADFRRVKVTKLLLPP